MSVVTPEPPARDRRDRKAEHLEIALDRSVQVETRPFDAWTFEHQALPEIALADVDTSAEFLGRQLASPLLISCMTGGTEVASRINTRLAEAAEQARVAVGVGSQRKAIEEGTHAETFAVRELAPSVPLLANLGAVQLNYGFGVDHCRQAVEMIEADALVLHLNPLQEAIQPEGQTDFSDLYPKMAQVVRALDPVPVVAKEVGSGISEQTARRLAEIGIRVIDTAGVGGTSWARIEARRSDDPQVGELFADWGIPTPDSIQAVARVAADIADVDGGLTVIGSGGLRSGLDVAKAIALGSHLAGMAYPFLRAADHSTERVVATVERITRELRIAMFAVGARNLAELASTPIQRRHP